MRENICCDVMPYGPNEVLLWTDVQPVHKPVRTQAYGLALSQSNFSILSVFCLVYNNTPYELPI